MRTIIYTVPDNISYVEYELRGGKGGAASDGTPGTEGDVVRVRKLVKPGEELEFQVGEGGKGFGGGQDGEPGSVKVWWFTPASPDLLRSGMYPLTERAQHLADKLADAGPEQKEAEIWVSSICAEAYAQGLTDARS